MVQRFPITLTQLTYFVECAKTLNMTAASQTLHVAQSAVSTAIGHLEKSLNADLFIRQHSKGLVLTPAGESLLRDTHQIFGLLTESVDKLRAEKNEVRGAIRIAFFNTLAPFLLPQLLCRLQEKYPDLIVEVIEGDYEENLADLRSGRAEIAINYQLTEVEDIRRRVVAKLRPHVILPPTHPLAGRKEMALADLTEDPFVLLNLPGSRDYFLGMLFQAGITPLLKYRSSSYETVRSMVAMGLGYSILNQKPLIDETYTGNKVVAVEISDEVPSLAVTVGSLAQASGSARGEAVYCALREVLAEVTPPA